MVEDEILLSPEGYQKLDDELRHLRTVKRREVAERIKIARQFGDLSENAEYDDAKNQQAFVEGRIMTVEKLLRLAVVVDGSDIDPTEVNIGSAVTVRDENTGDQYRYTIVGSPEADPAANRISYLSPVGKSLFGKQAGSRVAVKLPRGMVHYEILSVERD